MVDTASAETKLCASAISAAAIEGAKLMVGMNGAMAAPVVAQNGQKCEAALEEVRSAQKWNCAARNTNPSRRAQSLILLVLCSMASFGDRSSRPEISAHV